MNNRRIRLASPTLGDDLIVIVLHDEHEKPISSTLCSVRRLADTYIGIRDASHRSGVSLESLQRVIGLHSLTQAKMSFHDVAGDSLLASHIMYFDGQADPVWEQVRWSAFDTHSAPVRGNLNN